MVASVIGNTSYTGQSAFVEACETPIARRWCFGSANDNVAWGALSNACDVPDSFAITRMGTVRVGSMVRQSDVTSPLYEFDLIVPSTQYYGAV